MRARLLGNRWRVLLTVIVFVSAFTLSLAFFLRQVGTQIPLVDAEPWRASFAADDVKNLKVNSEVSIAGVEIGRVTDLRADGDHTEVVLGIEAEHGPLHEGATVRIGVKSVIGQSYVDLTDGDGTSMEEGSEIPAADVIPPVDIDEVLDTFDPRTRQALRSVVRGLGAGTRDQAESLDQLMTGLGHIGKEGTTVVDALAAQSDDLKALVQEAAVLMSSLDEGRGQIVDVVQQSRAVVSATAEEDAALAASIRKLPELMVSADTATEELEVLAAALAPVASDLRQAAPDLDSALRELPALTTDLQGMVGPLDAALRSAPATLDLAPAFTRDVQELIPEVEVLLSDVNPMLSYLSPYGRDIGAMFGSFGASMDVAMENGVQPIRLAPVFNAASVRGNPASLTVDPTTWLNPYPAPGQAGNPAPFRGDYPQVRRDEP